MQFATGAPHLWHSSRDLPSPRDIARGRDFLHGDGAPIATNRCPSLGSVPHGGRSRQHYLAVITIRPSWRKAARSSLRRFTPIAIGAILLQFWLASQSGGKDSPAEALPILILVLAVVADFTYRMTTVLELSPEQLAIRTWVTPRRLVPRSLIRGVALRRFYSYPYSQSFAVVYGDDGRRFATLPERIWEDDDVHRLQAALGSHDHSYRDVTRDEYKREFPGALNNYLGWLVALGVMAAIFVGIALQNR